MTERPWAKGKPIARGFERKRAKERKTIANANSAFGGYRERLEAMYGEWREKPLRTAAERRAAYVANPGLEIEDGRRATRAAKACAAHLEDLRRAYPNGHPQSGELTP